VPDGDASEKASSSQGECSLDAETSEIGTFVSRKALPTDDVRRVDRRVREDACIGTDRSKQVAANNPTILP
jgi:hypothetical protein